MRVNAPDDVFEQEADQMASAVMGMSSDSDAAPAGPGLRVQRAASSHDGGLETSPAVDASIAQMQGGGQPLPSGDRSFFENRFGHDFRQIRIHADSHAAQMAQSLNARAFTIEQSLVKALPTVIGFLADLLGLGGISQKVQQIITKVRSLIEKAITWLVQKAVALGKKLWALLKGKDKDKQQSGPDLRTRDDKQADLDHAIEAAERVMSGSDATPKSVRQQLPGIKNEYGLVSLDLIRRSKGKYVVYGKVNPDEYSDEKNLAEEGSGDITKLKSSAYQAISEAQGLVGKNPELKGEFDFAIRNLRKSGMIVRDLQVQMLMRRCRSS